MTEITFTIRRDCVFPGGRRGCNPGKPLIGDLTFERGRKIMTAPLPVIAEAAWRAIQKAYSG